MTTRQRIFFILPFVIAVGAFCGGYLLGADPADKVTRALLVSAFILSGFALSGMQSL